MKVVGHRFFFRDQIYRCAVGKGGFARPGEKREGDGKTPPGRFGLRECWYRADRLSVPETGLPKRVIAPDDGWCDDPAQALYNRHFKMAKKEFSFEHLWREDEAYDLIVPLGYNDDPVIPGLGSAIFMHVARPGYPPTEGCVALARGDLLEVLRHCDTHGILEITAE